MPGPVIRVLWFSNLQIQKTKAERRDKTEMLISKVRHFVCHGFTLAKSITNLNNVDPAEPWQRRGEGGGEKGTLLFTFTPKSEHYLRNFL